MMKEFSDRLSRMEAAICEMEKKVTDSCGEVCINNWSLKTLSKWMDDFEDELKGRMDRIKALFNQETGDKEMEEDQLMAKSIDMAPTQSAF